MTTNTAIGDLVLKDSASKSWIRRSIFPRSPFVATAYLLAALTALCILYPIAMVLVGLVWVDGGFSLASLRETVAIPGLGQTIRHTAIVAGSSAFFALIIGSVFAWLNERTNARIGVVTDILASRHESDESVRLLRTYEELTPA